MPTETPKLSYLSVVVSPEGVAEMDGALRTVFVPKADIQRIELMSGTAAERPLVQFILGVALIIAGLWGVKAIWLWLREGGTLFDLQVLLVIFLLLGAWMIWGGIRRRTYLLVSTGSDSRKVVFQGAVDSKRLEEFIGAATREFGYSIQSRLPDAPST